MRQKIVRSLLQASLFVFASLTSIDTVGAGTIHPAIAVMAPSGLLQHAAQNKIPSLNGYRGYGSARPGYIKSSNGYWYPARAFNTSNEYTGSIGRPQRMNNSCDFGFAPTNGSSNCNY
ncbi:cell surface protein [Rhizobium leguminosarum bv. trifolii]|uniref:cell surface protein n=1 Tax=Rhizobium leguminosarum TaxID=384 RepID=UPI000E2E827E|nr:cell surface protein [Rhizobium leguminosarum]RFB89853.1 cell surface protein [Rhizobium leguminosarum bv. trifolii]